MHHFVYKRHKKRNGPGISLWLILVNLLREHNGKKAFQRKRFLEN